MTEARLESLDQLALQTRLDAIGKATFSARRERLCYRSTSEMGQFRKSALVIARSALPPGTDIVS